MTELLEGSSFLETEPRGEEFREEEFTSLYTQLYFRSGKKGRIAAGV